MEYDETKVRYIIPPLTWPCVHWFSTAVAWSGHISGVTAEQIKKAREHAPFRPFTVFISNQRRFEIRHPDYVWIVPGGRLIGIADESGSVELIDLVHVTSLKTNGSAE